jgi:hypothetical protein
MKHWGRHDPFLQADVGLSTVKSKVAVPKDGHFR